MLVVFQQFFRQAHGPAQIVSDCAIDNLDFQHDPSANFERLYHSAKIAIKKILAIQSRYEHIMTDWLFKCFSQPLTAH